MKKSQKKLSKKNKSEKKVFKKKKGKVSPEIIEASRIASFYGFEKIENVEVKKEDVCLAKKFTEANLKTVHPFSEKKDRFSGYLEEKISLVHSFINKSLGINSIPVMGYYEGPMKGNPHLKRIANEKTFNLEAIGSSKSIVDATIIEASYVILKERYPKENFIVEINSVGDKESSQRLFKELTNFIKKEEHRLAKQCRDIVKKDIFGFLSCSHTSCAEVKDLAPKPMSYLSEESRNHFKEVLEFLESLEIPYEINHSLIGSKSYCSEIIFEIKNERDKNIYAIGERYNGLAKKIWGKRDVPGIGSALLIHPHFIDKNIKIKKEEASKFFFIQLGFDAKKKSLKIIETLRKNKISVKQSLSKDKISVQISNAEKMGIPYVIIVGQKEAIEDTVVIRKLSSMSQDTIPVAELPKYLKKLK